MKRCPRCGTEQADHSFCSRCGAKLTETTPPQVDMPPSGSKKCPKCGVAVGNWIYCNNCGADLRGTVRPTDKNATQNAEFYTPPEPPVQKIVQPIQPVQPKPKPNNSQMPVIITAIVAAAVVIAAVVLVILLLNFDKPKPAPSESSAVSDVSDTQSSTVPVTQVTNDPYADLVYMPICRNQPLADVKKQLTELGLKVEEKYTFSRDIKKGNIVSQNPDGSTQLKKGDTVILYISKGSETSPYDYSQKLTVTASGSSGKAVLYERKEGDWSQVVSYNATVGRNGIGTTTEGSATSPKGVHRLGVVLCSQAVSTNLNYYRVTGDTCVVDDTSSSYYNCILERSFIPSGTHYDNIGNGLTNGTTYATIYIEHNGSGLSSAGVVRGNGSAIGVRGQYGSLSATLGDVDISAGDMQDLLSRLDANKHPVIELK